MTDDDDAATQAAIERVCFARGIDEELARAPREVLARLGVRGAELDALAAQADRLLVYRRSVRATVSHVVRETLPETRARLAEFDQWLDAFLDEVGPRSQRLRDLPGALVRWAAPSWDAAVADRARIEVARFESGAAPEGPEPNEAPPALDRGLLFVSSVRLVRGREGATLVHRDTAHQVHARALSPAGAALVERLLEGAPLGVAVAQTGADAGEAALLLADLAARGVVVGADPPHDPADVVELGQ